MAPPEDEPPAERTLLIPGGGGTPPEPPAHPEPSSAAVSPQEPPVEWATPIEPVVEEPPPTAAAAATVFMPSLPPAGGKPSETGGTDPPSASPVWSDVLPEPAVYIAPQAAAPVAEAAANGEGRIAPGVVLNHIYEVRRFIARGGMGEVYEGINVNTDERVAIKVILPHLAMDHAVQAMFRKEARTLTRLSHPGLVQYRVLAQEPALGVLYIVTDFIDGGQLSEYIGQIHPGADELESLLRRLAAGLAAAHELGAIHRDISPDNVLLPEGRLDHAKIIDFGIAKDLDASSKTIVGDGFAGKLGFVAPEQFGDFDREIGPWTDVYSLALVLLTVAEGKPVDMGATLVDAIDKRRKGPDLSAVPDRLRPVFEGMLAPNPQNRFRYMKDVLEALDRTSGKGAALTPPTPADLEGQTAPPAKPKARSPMPLIAAAVGSVVVLALIGVGVAMMGHKAPPAGPAAVAGAGAGASAPAPGGQAEKVRQAVEAALPQVACTWLDIDDANDGANGVSLRLSGVAGSPVDAQQAIQKAAAATGAKIDLVDTANVFPVGQATCAPLDTFRAFRAPASDQGRLISSPQSNWELMAKNPPCTGANAKAVVDIKTGPPSQDFTCWASTARAGCSSCSATAPRSTSSGPTSRTSSPTRAAGIIPPPRARTRRGWSARRWSPARPPSTSTCPTPCRATPPSRSTPPG